MCIYKEAPADRDEEARAGLAVRRQHLPVVLYIAWCIVVSQYRSFLENKVLDTQGKQCAYIWSITNTYTALANKTSVLREAMLDYPNYYDNP